MFKTIKKGTIRAFKIIFNIKSQRQPVAYPLDPELIKANKQFQEVIKGFNSRDAQLSEVFAQKRAESEAKKKLDSEQEVIKKINEQNREIKLKKFKDSFSFSKFYTKLSKDKKFRNSFELVDRDDSVILGKFGDFLVLPNGHLAVTNSLGEVMAYGSTLRNLVYKPGSMSNQARRKRFLLACDKDFVFYPDVEEHEVEEGFYDEKIGKIRWAKIREKPFKVAIVERETKIQDLKEYGEHLEQKISDLTGKIGDLTRANNVLNRSAENSQTELSKAMERSIQFEQKMSDMQMQVVRLNEVKSLNEKIINTLEGINSELLEKAEEMGVKTEFRKALDSVQGLIDWAKDKIPKTIIQTPIPEKEPREPVKPGQPI